MTTHQFSLTLIPHKVENSLIEQRASDGYINATAMCKAAGKLIADYIRLKTTKEFLEELSSDMGIPISELIQLVKGGNERLQGTWVHPDVAIHLAQWLSPRFSVLVAKWVREWLSGGKVGGENLPYHLRRYMANRSEIPYTHFSVFNEVIFGLVAPLEDGGYTLPDAMVPDISQGRMFAKWLREVMNIDTDEMPTYRHTYPDGRAVDGAKMYPISLLAAFREHFNAVWIPTKAKDYFKSRDPNALPYLDRILALPSPKQQIPKPVRSKKLAHKK